MNERGRYYKTDLKESPEILETSLNLASFRNVEELEISKEIEYWRSFMSDSSLENSIDDVEDEIISKEIGKMEFEKNNSKFKFIGTPMLYKPFSFLRNSVDNVEEIYKMPISTHECKPYPDSLIFFDIIYKSLNEKYDNIDNLKTSPIDECLNLVNNISKYHLYKIIDNLTKHNQLEEYQKSCLNCLHLSINIISKYIEKHRPSITVNYSNLLFVFDAFFDIISLNHLAERICESILYAMCSILNIEGKKLIDKKWKDKLELCFHNNKINETIKLASSVILVQMDISNIELIQEIARYLFKNINIKYCQEDFGFTESEINEARKNAIKKLFDNCENIKASSSLEICNAIVCDETNLKEIEICVNEIKNEVIYEKNQ